eukprot:2284521-Amphidinium_carterae.1
MTPALHLLARPVPNIGGARFGLQVSMCVAARWSQLGRESEREGQSRNACVRVLDEVCAQSAE